MRTLEIIRQEVAACTKCELHKTRTQTVFARGNPNAHMMMVAEAPGVSENEQGLPLVGLAGQLLDSVIKELGYDTNRDFYLCNIIKCWPPGNRKPTEEEINCCIDYLDEQLSIINPKVIVALGNTAVAGLLPIEMGITKIHGKWFKRGKIFVLPAYHPSFVARNGSTGKVYDDFKNDLQTAIIKVKDLTQ